MTESLLPCIPSCNSVTILGTAFADSQSCCTLNQLTDNVSLKGRLSSQYSVQRNASFEVRCSLRFGY